MDPLALPQLVEKYGAWGVVAALVAFSGWALKGWHDCAEARIADAKESAAILEKATSAMLAVAAALESRTGIFERLGVSVEDSRREAAEGRREASESRRDINSKLEAILLHQAGGRR